jgi:RHS repeat-associated protein
MKFTGHERDLASLAGAGDDLDYMHARHANPITGRFTSVDASDPNPKAPLSWNRYTYSLNNPVLLVDPNGLTPIDPVVRQFLETFFGTDLSRVDVRTGALAAFVTNVARGADGVTIGDTIHLSLKGGEQYSNRSAQGISLIGHEVVHTFDYQKLGVSLFLA